MKHENCEGCLLLIDDNCVRYEDPNEMWEIFESCPSATHIARKIRSEKKSTNPLKLAKKAMKNKLAKKTAKINKKK